MNSDGRSRHVSGAMFFENVILAMFMSCKNYTTYIQLKETRLSGHTDIGYGQFSKNNPFFSIEPVTITSR